MRFTPDFIANDPTTERAEKHSRSRNGGKRSGGGIIGPAKFFNCARINPPTALPSRPVIRRRLWQTLTNASDNLAVDPASRHNAVLLYVPSGNLPLINGLIHQSRRS